jgi:hypothetical protein
MPGHPQGKPAGQPCANLLDDRRCGLWGHPDRPAVCASLRPEPSMCLDSAEAALAGLLALERATCPDVDRM